MKAEVVRSIADIPDEAWDACFPGDPENWAYYRAIEEAGLPAFSWAYFVVREAGRIVCVAPAFLTDYRLDTTLQGKVKTLLAPVLALFGNALVLRLLCLGSPQADRCHIGFAPDLGPGQRSSAATQLLAAFAGFAGQERIGLLAAKDVSDAALGEGWGEALAAAGFARQRSLPIATLALPGDEEAYLASLSPGTRREVRRKLKAAGAVRIEKLAGAQALGCVPQIAALYDGQRQRSGVDYDQFEVLTPAYFRAVLERLGDRAVVFLYFHETRLVAFNLCLVSPRLFIDKFIGLAQPEARALNLYVLSWMQNVRHCVANRIPVLQTGQTGYAMKLRMGSTLANNWLYFRHRRRLPDFFLRLAGPLLAADRHDETLAGSLRGTQ